MTDEGDGQREPPVTGTRGSHAGVPKGQWADAGAVDAEGVRVNRRSPRESAGPVSPTGPSASSARKSRSAGARTSSSAGARNSRAAAAPGMPTAGMPVPDDGAGVTGKHAAPGGTAVTTSGGAAGGGAAGSGAAGGGATAGGQQDAPGAPPGKKAPAKKSRSFWKELPVLVVVALVLTLVIKTYAIQAFYIPSGSMQNTLAITDRVLVNKLVYDVRSIHRGDVVVFTGNGSWDPGPPPQNSNVFVKFGDNVASMLGLGQGQNDYIKRVIGLPGDHVACCDAQGRVTVNGIPLTEQSYLYPGNAPSTSRFSITVPPGRLWVMGDHRAVSYDSRGHIGDPGGGTIPENAVVGRAFVVIWPVSNWRLLPIPATFQQPKLNASMTSVSSHTRSADEAAAASGAAAPVHPSGPAMPFALGFAGAVPVTWLQRKLRKAARRRFRR
jgi:signal peptidase I